MPAPRSRIGFRLAAFLAIGGMAAGCAPVGPGPYQQQANNAAYACQQGIREACQDYQALAPAANAEAYQDQRNAAVGTALAAGAIGVVAGAAIASSSRSRRGYYDRGYGRGYGRHYGPSRYHRHGYYR